MKPNQLITTMLAATALFVASCTAPKLAQNNVIQDDVYNTVAKAREFTPQPLDQNLPSERIDDSNYRQSDPFYDMDYSSRIDRFYYGNSNRGYYDPYYNYYGYNSFGFNNYGNNSYYSPYHYGFGLNSYFNGYYNNFNNLYYNWGYYGSPYYSNFWGPYSYYDAFGYGGGYYGNRYNYPYYGGTVTVRNNENYRPRPSRGGENGTVRADGTVFAPGSSRATNGNGNANTLQRTRAEMYNPVNKGTTTPARSNGTSSAPTRSNNGSDGRPTRSNDTQSRPTPPPTTTQPAQQQSRPPVQSSPPPTRGESNSGRPTRGNG